MSPKLLHSGKVKEVWSTDVDGVLEFRFTDRISVFDQIIPSMIPGKGKSLNHCATYWMEAIERSGICPTHLIERTSSKSCLVKAASIHREAGTTPRDAEWVFVPLEFVSRHYLTGSALRRLERGELSREDLGLAPDIEIRDGLQLPEPFVEVTTKFESHDRPVEMEEALAIANLRPEEFKAITSAVLAIDDLIEERCNEIGLIHVDGKKEFALGENRIPVLVDTLGTLDEDRWWDAGALEGGEIQQLSKEFVRRHYMAIGHLDELEQARADGLPEPPIPALPEGLITQTSTLYHDLAKRITGQG